MDPNAALRELRELTKKEPDTLDAVDVARLSDLFQGLDQWIAKGGFLPDSWQIGQKRSQS